MTKKELYKSIKKWYDEGHDYHTLKFPDGTILKGKWDMSKYIQHYKIPADLTGHQVLEIGPASGYFSFEMSKRGGKVTAIDQNRGWWKEEINQLMSANVEYKVQDLSTLDESFGKFDLVFCSNVLQHTSDIFGNIQRIKKVTKHQAILSLGILMIPNFDEIPLALFLGSFKTQTNDQFVGSYWRPTMACFKKLAKDAGFKKVEEISKFKHQREDGEAKLLEGVIHCFV